MFHNEQSTTQTPTDTMTQPVVFPYGQRDIDAACELV